MPTVLLHWPGVVRAETVDWLIANCFVTLTRCCTCWDCWLIDCQLFCYIGQVLYVLRLVIDWLATVLLHWPGVVRSGPVVIANCFVTLGQVVRVGTVDWLIANCFVTLARCCTCWDCWLIDCQLFCYIGQVLYVLRLLIDWLATVLLHWPGVVRAGPVVIAHCFVKLGQVVRAGTVVWLIGNCFVTLGQVLYVLGLLIDRLATVLLHWPGVVRAETVDWLIVNCFVTLARCCTCWACCDCQLFC